MPEESRSFIAVFGEPHAMQHPVDGGVYPIPLSYCPAIGEGDKVLLFCLKDYPGHSWEAPGIGIVNQTTQRSHNGCVFVDVLYAYHPLNTPIRRDAVMGCLTQQEARQLMYPRFKANWLRRIGDLSARRLGLSDDRWTGGKSLK